MKKLILLFCVVASFVACKKVENLTKVKPTSSDLTVGVHNLADFDQAITEMSTVSNLRTPSQVIKLSSKTIELLRNSITFDKNGIFHGFGNMGNLRTELTIEQRVAFTEKLVGGSIIILNKDKKIIGQSKVITNSNSKYALPKILCDDYYLPCPTYSYNAACVQ